MFATSGRRIGWVERAAGFAVALAAALVPGSASLTAQAPRVALDQGDIEARVWLDRGDQPLLSQGDQVRVYYRAAEDAYVAIFHIDTDGTATLAFPHSPDEDHYVRGGRDYRLLFPRSPYWFVEDAPGVGYFFIVASAEPFDFSSFRFSRYDRGWDLSLVGRQVYRDPYVAMDDYIAALLPDWQSVPYAVDFTSYDVGSRHEYPRFLCYECHAFRSYSAWNPYYTACTNFRVVIYDDPYFYPARRYRGDRVVWAQPPTPYYSRYDFRARAVGESARAIVAPRPASEPTRSLRPAVMPRRDPANGAGGVVAPSNEPTNLGTLRGRPTAPQPTAQQRPATQPQETPSTAQPRAGTRPTPTRPSEGARGGGVASPGTSAAPRPEGAPTIPPDSRQRPVLQRRPSEGSTQTPAPTQAPPPSTRGTQPTSGGSTGSQRPSGQTQSGEAQPTRPPTSPSPSGDGRRAQPRPSGESGESAPPPRSSGSNNSGTSNSSGSSGERPTVRRTPDGRPVVR